MGYIVTFFFQMHEVKISNEGELYQNHRYNIYFLCIFLIQLATGQALM